MLSCLWDGTNKRTLAANQKWQQHVSCLLLSKCPLPLYSMPYNVCVCVCVCVCVYGLVIRFVPHVVEGCVYIDI